MRLRRSRPKLVGTRPVPASGRRDAQPPDRPRQAPSNPRPLPAHDPSPHTALAAHRHASGGAIGTTPPFCVVTSRCAIRTTPQHHGDGRRQPEPAGRCEQVGRTRAGRGARGAGFAAAHIVYMTTLLLERPGTTLDFAIQEAVEPERLRWSSLYSDGTCNWSDAPGLISLVGVLEEFTFLTLHRDDSVDPLQRFFQCAGGSPGGDGRLLAEIGSENDVAVVAPSEAGWGRKVPITAAEPWVYSEADELVLLPREVLLPIAFDWIMRGTLDPLYRLRSVPTYSMPAVNG